MNKYFINIIINMIKKFKEDDNSSSFDELLIHQIIPDIIKINQLNQQELNYIIENI